MQDAVPFYYNIPSDKISPFNIRWLWDLPIAKNAKNNTTPPVMEEESAGEISDLPQLNLEKTHPFLVTGQGVSLHRISHAINRNSKIIALRDGGSQEMWTRWIHHEMFHVKLFIIPYLVKLLNNDFSITIFDNPFVKTNLSHPFSLVFVCLFVLLFTSIFDDLKQKTPPFPRRSMSWWHMDTDPWMVHTWIWWEIIQQI